MRASLDTNVIIHLYQADMQSILFDVFKDGLFIYEQIRNVELEHHGQMVIEAVDADIQAGKLELYTDEKLKEQGVYNIFESYFTDNRWLYTPKDLGEVYAISLAQTIGAYSLVTDDIKQGGPYMSLMQLDDDVKPFTFADILLLRYLLGIVDAHQTIADFNVINERSNLNWAFKSQFARFFRRFVAEPYKEEERIWFSQWTSENGIKVQTKFKELKELL